MNDTSRIDSDADSDSSARALDVARRLAVAGVPLFVAAPAPGTAVGYALPSRWETSAADPRVVDQWRPGWALCAIGGGPVDFLDVDPRNGGQRSVVQLEAGGAWPRTFGQQNTPSGGMHCLITPLRIGKYQGKGDLLGGLDLQGGRPDGTGRGFVFLAPTIRRSKATGEMVAYRWEIEPDLDALAEWAAVGDDSGQALRSLIVGARRVHNEYSQGVDSDGATSVTLPTDPFDAAPRAAWSEIQAKREIQAKLEILRTLTSGSVEPTLNEVAMFVGHFVGALPEWPAAVLRRSIKNALDVGGWHSDKWNVDHGLAWTADSKITHAFRDAARDGLWCVERDDPPGPDGPLVSTGTASDQGADGPADGSDGSTDGADRYPPIDWAELYGRDWTAIDWLPGRFVERGQQMALIGDGKAGKSMFAFEWAWRMSAGLSFLGDDPHPAIRVLYVDRENSQDDLYRRAVSFGATPEQLANLFYLSFPPFPPLDADGSKPFLEQVARYRADVVILDTVSRFVAGKENDSDTWLALYRRVHAYLKSANVAGVRLDHFGKDAEKGGRGSSAKSQDVDHVWELAAGNSTTQPSGEGSDEVLVVATQVTLSRTHTRSGRGHEMLAIVRIGHKDRAGQDWLAGQTRHEAAEGGMSGAVWIAAHRIAAMLDDMGVPNTAGRDRCRMLLKGQAAFDNSMWPEIKGYRGSRPELPDIVPIPETSTS